MSGCTGSYATIDGTMKSEERDDVMEVAHHFSSNGDIFAEIRQRTDVLGIYKHVSSNKRFTANLVAENGAFAGF